MNTILIILISAIIVVGIFFIGYCSAKNMFHKGFECGFAHALTLMIIKEKNEQIKNKENDKD